MFSVKQNNILLFTLLLCLFNTVVYSVLTHQYITNNTQVLLHVSVLPNHLHASIYYMEVHSVCTYSMGSHSVYIKSYHTTRIYTPSVTQPYLNVHLTWVPDQLDMNISWHKFYSVSTFTLIGIFTYFFFKKIHSVNRF
jgi:hypothetical protein